MGTEGDEWSGMQKGRDKMYMLRESQGLCVGLNSCTTARLNYVFVLWIHGYRMHMVEDRAQAMAR